MSEIELRLARRRGLAVVVALGVVVRFLWWAGRLLGPPRVTSWADAERWYEGVGPAAGVIAAVRAIALALALWWLAAAALQLLATVVRAPSAQWVADLIAPRSLQRLVHGLAGLSLSAGLAVPAPGAGILGPPPGAGTATMRVVSEEAPPAAPPATPVPAPVAAAPAPEPAPVPPPAQEVVVVAAGDSLWSIAEEALSDAGRSPVDEHAVATYWRRVIDHNQAMLVDRSNPDLIYPGQLVSLPEP